VFVSSKPGFGQHPVSVRVTSRCFAERASAVHARVEEDNGGQHSACSSGLDDGGDDAGSGGTCGRAEAHAVE
jgi:hypothetical protein